MRKAKGLMGKIAAMFACAVVISVLSQMTVMAAETDTANAGVIEASDATIGTTDAAAQAAAILAAQQAIAAADAQQAGSVAIVGEQTTVSNDELMLLAALIYCEAGNQPYEGKVAVGNVVLNRMKSSKFPNTMREVIYQRKQFSPAGSGKLDRVLASGNIQAECIQAAQDALNGATPVGASIFFMRKELHSSGIIISAHCFWGTM